MKLQKALIFRIILGLKFLIAGFMLTAVPTIAATSTSPNRTCISAPKSNLLLAQVPNPTDEPNPQPLQQDEQQDDTEPDRPQSQPQTTNLTISFAS
ncbi:hypothetical protein G7B40_025765 [Aetokthonos hydrillicola Thurmond2011]|jgi:hypothetical protein|uniref:Uncharacterized protein n=1 Tax=Aetokthonos hydrillicola Thurmond2011 TaxID=2712845 RepID=A0AAP5IE06_9CYAN|nr:hypothetical protein [Aetokthonos hydrillicola]MBO3460676.1 hypothetical protein [Aetokthonos hydrillicola CCALA 1050]MBW4587674.1 hypothetical protein [Aetokthonos hydrillicola CCALA 1050]MDR9897943.1 hypothetical protein [Aetokthonos hydrillicola Thurmond2011]